jgi:hypothetical protein
MVAKPSNTQKLHRKQKPSLVLTELFTMVSAGMFFSLRSTLIAPQNFGANEAIYNHKQYKSQTCDVFLSAQYASFACMTQYPTNYPGLSLSLPPQITNTHPEHTKMHYLPQFTH